MEKTSEIENRDVFQSLATPIAALSLLYTLLFLILDNTQVASPSFWKSSLIFVILLITFFFSVYMIGSSNNKNEFLKTAGLLMFILWFVILFYLQSVIIEGYKSLLSPFVSIGMGWLILIPMFGIPLGAIITSNFIYKKIKNFRNKIIFGVVSILISIFFYLMIKNPSILFSKLTKLIIKIPIGWLQVIGVGILVGIFVALIVAPCLPALNSIMQSIFNLKKRKNERKNN